MRQAIVRMLAVVPLLAFALTPSTASAATQIFQNASISLISAQLTSAITVDATFHYSCTLPGPGNLRVAIDQNGTQASNVLTVATCDGSNQAVTVTVAGGPFVPGRANAVYLVTNANFTSQAEVLDEIQLK
jgi:VCBS repeat-containing protein